MHITLVLMIPFPKLRLNIHWYIIHEFLLETSQPSLHSRPRVQKQQAPAPATSAAPTEHLQTIQTQAKRPILMYFCGSPNT
jgi:hypothetical protein